VKTDENPTELWCLHGALGEVGDWRMLSERTTDEGATVYPLDLWRFLCCEPVDMARFGQLLNALVRPSAAAAPPARRVLLGYSMGGRLALHALLSERGHPWDAAVIVSAHPGLEEKSQRAARREADAEWAAAAHSGDWSEMLERWNAQPIFSAGGGMRPVADRAGLVRQRREVARSFVAWSLGAQSIRRRRSGTPRAVGSSRRLRRDGAGVSRRCGGSPLSSRRPLRFSCRNPETHFTTIPWDG